MILKSMNLHIASGVQIIHDIQLGLRWVTFPCKKVVKPECLVKKLNILLVTRNSQAYEIDVVLTSGVFFMYRISRKRTSFTKS